MNKKLIITTSWDDGHILDIKLAELLKKYGIKGTFYISPESREIPANKRLSQEQIKKLSEDFEIGAHTMIHPNLQKIDDETVRKEIVESKKYLEDVIKKEVSSFCYPSGYYNEKHKAIVKDAGFTLARTVERFRTDIGDDSFALPTTIHAYKHWSDIFSIIHHSCSFRHPSVCHPRESGDPEEIKKELDSLFQGNDRKRHEDKRVEGNSVGIKKFFKSYLNWDELAISIFDKIVSKTDLDSRFPSFAKSFGRARRGNDRKSRVFHLWGHSWEIEKNNDWERLERVLRHIGGRKDVVYAENASALSLSRSNSPLKPTTYNLPPTTSRCLLIVTPYFPPYGGGLERYAFEIAQRLHTDHQWRVVVITSGERYETDAKEEKNGLTIYRLAYKLKISNTPFSFKWFKKIRDILNKENPDIINIHTPVPGIGDITAILAKNKPIVVTYHVGSMRKGKLLLDVSIWLYENFILRRLLKKAKRIVCASDFVRFNFLGKYQYKSSTITPAVDTNLFKPALEKKTEYPSILFVAGLGRAEQHKGLQTLIDAVKELQESIHDIRLVVVGDGDMRSEYEERVKKLGLEKVITFTGRLSGKELAEQYQKAHIFALPSSNESFSMVILEAMASGLPVVATNVGGIPFLVEDGKTGILISPNNSAILYKKLSNLLMNPEFSISMGNAGRIKAKEKFDWDSRASQYNGIFTENIKNISHNLRILETPVRYYPYIGGVEYYVYYLSQKLLKLGYDVSVLCANEPESKKNEIINGVDVQRLKYRFKIANTNITFGLPRTLWKTDFDIAHTHIPTPWSADWTIFISKLKKKPVVLTVHSDFDKPDFMGKLIIWIYLHTIFKLVLHFADKIIIVNPEWKTTFKKTAHIFKPFEDKIIGLPTAVDTDIFVPPRIKNQNNTILFVSVLDEYHRFKGFEYLMNSMLEIKREIPDVKLIVIGDGVLLNEYKEKVKRLGLEKAIEFHGKKTQAELIKYYQSANVFTLPSIEIEGFAIVLLEAMACGIPVVASDAHGVAKDIIKYGTGLVVPARDSNSLAEAIISIIKDKQKQEEMGNNGKKLIDQKYSWEIISENISKVFKEIYEKRK